MTRMSDEQRPAVWVGHVAMTVSDPAIAHDFYINDGYSVSISNSHVVGAV